MSVLCSVYVVDTVYSTAALVLCRFAHAGLYRLQTYTQARRPRDEGSHLGIKDLYSCI